MVDAQKWLKNRRHYPDKERRREVSVLVPSRKNLPGHLDLSDFVKLRIIGLEHNRLTSLNISKNYKLEQIDTYANQISADLAIFSHLVNLKYLYLGGINFSNGQIYGNDFSGSLKAFENCQQLEQLDISANKRIIGGLECLPTEKLVYFGCRGTAFEEILAPYGDSVRGIKKWREANPILIDKVQKEKITEEREAKKSQLLTQLRNLITILLVVPIVILAIFLLVPTKPKPKKLKLSQKKKKPTKKQQKRKKAILTPKIN